VVLTSITFLQEGLDLGVEKVSRVHFTLHHGLGEDSTYLTDNSLNGTWVNKLRIGKRNKTILDHCSIISVLCQEMEMFCYLDRKVMEREFPPSLTSKYLVGKILGEGTTSVVRLGYRRGDYSKVALKMINTKSWPTKYSEPTDLMAEVTVLADMEHPCITKVEEVVEAEDLMIIVMEFANGGELFDQVVKDYKANDLYERKAKLQFYQVVDTVKYMHSKQVCHRDLKLENLLLAQPGSLSLIKVSDFGLSKVWGESLLHSYVGTPVYMAPEVLAMGEKKVLMGYTSKADCWSLGVILYLLLCGKHPFSKGEEMIQNIMEGKIRSMTGSMWDSVSSTAKNLVRALLETDPGKRLSASQVLEHPWFSCDQDVCIMARRIMAGGVVDKMRGGVKEGVVGVDTVKGMKEVPLIDLTQDSEE